MKKKRKRVVKPKREVVERIRICSNHKDYEVPLISTFIFSGAEYWCPYCGVAEGFLGAGEFVDCTEELKKRSEMYLKATEEYRNAKGSLACSSLEYKGKRITPSELPKELIEDYKKTSWKLKIKVEKKK